MIRVAIIGAGPAGLATAWGLTEPPPEGENPESVKVTVYDTSWRAGGKCAGTRLFDGHRIVQNGTHYVFGVYFNALRMVQRAHQEVGDPRYGEATDFVPRNLIAMKRFLPNDEWENWIFELPKLMDGLPAETEAYDSPESYLAGVFQWLKDELEKAGLLPSGSFSDWLDDLDLGDLFKKTAGVLGNLGGKSLGDLLDYLIEKSLALAADPNNALLRQLIKKAIEVLRWWLHELLEDNNDPRLIRLRILFDFVLTVLCGILADGVLTGNIAAVDDVDLAHWLAGHGAQQETVESPFVRAWYDSVAAYTNGDPAQPSLSAAAFLQSIIPALVAYRTSFCYQMKAEVGESLVLPIYEALKRRGVEFRFLHELDEVVPTSDGTKIEQLVFRVPRLPSGPGDAEAALETYDPLVETPVLKNGTTRMSWPPGPKAPFDFLGQVTPQNPHMVRAFGPTRDVVTRQLGVHFDRVVFALPHTTVRRVGKERLEQKAEWKDLADHLPSVETKSLRLWLRTQFEDIEWDTAHKKTPPVLSAYQPTFSTWEDSGQQLDLHVPTADEPLSIATVFGPLPAGTYPPTCQFLNWLMSLFRRFQARNDARAFLKENAGKLWPGLVETSGVFRWNQLVPAGTSIDAVDTQWIIANTGATERYTHAAPGTFKYRLRSDETGYANLSVAGEWARFWPGTASVELAVMSGLRAAYDIRGVSTEVKSEKGFFPSS